MLSKINLPFPTNNLEVPESALFDLPERVIQFGTGVLLRGLPDFYIDKANKKGIFNGRIAVVKSTSTGSKDAFELQDNLYSIHIRGIRSGKEVQENIICSSISRVLSAHTQWIQILEIAKNKEIKIVISNTTEVGITYVEEYMDGSSTPVSFPGKLLAFLCERFKTFGNDMDRGLVIIPTELVPDNGRHLKEIVLKLSAFNNLNKDFIHWLSEANQFCNSLVDRIVPGKPDELFNKTLDKDLGYEDELRIVAEPYSLWAIEGNSKIAEILSFTKANTEIIIAQDIEKYKELKLRLLNATHTLCCALAFLAGFTTVYEAMANGAFKRFITQLMMKEICRSIPYHINSDEQRKFAESVLERFSNPYIKHPWLSISFNYSLKLRIRVLPLLHNYFKLYQTLPEAMILGFGAFIRFMKLHKSVEGFEGNYNGINYKVTDSNALKFSVAWELDDYEEVVNTILKDENIWGTDLSVLPEFTMCLVDILNKFDTYGMRSLLELNYKE